MVNNTRVNSFLCGFSVKFCPKFEDKFFSEKFSAAMEFSKIDPWSSKGSEKKNVLSYLVSIGGG
jgi:hypothetical protein